MSLFGGLIGKALNPSPSAASVGTRPLPTTMPDPFASLSSVYPGLSQQNALASNDINSLLSGNLSPGTVNSIQDFAARMGMNQTGTTGAPFNLYGGAADIGRTSQQLQQQGLQDYGSILGTIFNTQTLSPQLQAMIDTYNKQIAAAPDPVAAAKYAMDLYQMNQISQGLGDMAGSFLGGGGGTSGAGGMMGGFLGGLI